MHYSVREKGNGLDWDRSRKLHTVLQGPRGGHAGPRDSVKSDAMSTLPSICIYADVSFRSKFHPFLLLSSKMKVDGMFF